MTIKDPKKVKQGKKNRAAGARFELKVREDMEQKGWNISKFQNNVQLRCKACDETVHVKPDKPYCKKCEDFTEYYSYKQVAAKASRFRLSSSGFPDFIAIKYNKTIYKLDTDDHSKIDKFKKQLEAITKTEPNNIIIGSGVKIYPEYEVIAIEAKSNGYLDRVEKAKCQWMLDNHVFSKILIAHKGLKRGEILYKDFIDYIYKKEVKSDNNK